MPASDQYLPGGAYPQLPQYPGAPPDASNPYGPQVPYGGMWPPYGMQGPYEPYGAGANGYQPAPTPRPSRDWLLPLVLVLVGLLIAGGGVYAFSRPGARTTTLPATAHGTATPSGTSGLPAGFTTYRDPDGLVEFALPPGWTTQGSVAGSSGLRATSPDGYSFIGLQSFDGARSTTGAVDASVKSMQASSSCITPTRREGVPLAGEAWSEATCDVMLGPIFQAHMELLVANHANKTYALAFLATRDTYADSDARYFQPIKRSFRFLA